LPHCSVVDCRSHSLMDKMQDSGSCDLGSIPGGITDTIIIA
jgi:hypothetical protein